MAESSESRAELARQFFLDGCNCAQSVVSAFSDLIGCDADILLRLCSGLGGGIGRLRETCGAFLGAVLVLDGTLGSADPADGAAKTAQYRRIQRLAGDFRRENGSLICRQMLDLPDGPSDPVPAPRTPDYYHKRPCPSIIYNAAALADAVIRSEKREKPESINPPCAGYNRLATQTKEEREMTNSEKNCHGENCDQANPSIECTVTQCRNHCGTQNFCSLKAIRVVTHEDHPTEIACTDCSSFELK